MDSFPLHLPPIYYIYCREMHPVDSTRVHVHCRCTHTNAILKAQWPLVANHSQMGHSSETPHMSHPFSGWISVSGLIYPLSLCRTHPGLGPVVEKSLACPMWDSNSRPPAALTTRLRRPVLSCSSQRNHRRLCSGSIHWAFGSLLPPSSPSVMLAHGHFGIFITHNRWFAMTSHHLAICKSHCNIFL